MMNDKELLNMALAARTKAYAPYSGFRVGAALLANDGRVFTGCNVENASYSATLCAERNAFGAAVSAGAQSFAAIAVAGGAEELPDPSTPPCGVCRQVMAEFCGPEFKIILGNQNTLAVYTLGDLLPLAFDAKNLEE